MQGLYIQILIFIGINSISALGLHVVTGLAGQFSLAQAAFSGLGAYASALMSIKAGASFPISLLTGIVIAAFVSLIVGWPSLRLRGDYLAIATLGFGEVFRVIMLNTEYTGKALGIHGVPKQTNFAWTYISLAFCIGIVYLLTKSRIGRAWIAIRDDEAVAEAFGTKLSKYKLLAFVLSGAFAGLSGGLYVHYILYANPADFGVMKSVEVLLYIIIGGLGSIPGVIVGTTLLTGLPEFLRGFAQYRMLVYGLLLVILMIYRPQGILGSNNSQQLQRLVGRLTQPLQRGKGGNEIR